jgi:hypothetical protein
VAKDKNGSWIVIVNVTSKKEIICENCTEQQATDNPYNYMVEERDIETLNVDVCEVSKNL